MKNISEIPFPLLAQARDTFQASVDTLRRHVAEHGDVLPTRHDIRELVLICSSSRSGSSLLFHELARSQHLLSPRGEQTPFEKLFLPTLELSGSDALAQQHTVPEDMVNHVWQGLETDLGLGRSIQTIDDIERYRLELEFRLPLQWPGKVSPEDVRRALHTVLSRQHSTARVGQEDGQHGPVASAERVFWQVIRELEGMGLLSAHYYDAAPLEGNRALPEAWMGPPNDVFNIEVPPFLPILPRQKATSTAWHRMPLLLKASANAYRLPFIRAFFPQARLKIIHLIRNPAAAINGLMDGWLHRGFFTYNFAHIPVELRITGYSERCAWGRHWWKFVLPPGWQDYITERLERVCAFQWASAHQHVFDFTERHPQVEYMRVAFEDLLCGALRRQTLLDHITDFLALPRLATNAAWRPAEVIMATAPPNPGRWRKRQDLILPVLADAALRDMAGRLGYHYDRRTEWI